MKKEKIVLSFLAVLTGILAAGIGFYLYQTFNQTQKPISKITPSTTPQPTKTSTETLIITTPQDESVVDTKTIPFSGKVDPLSTVIISTSDNDVVVKPDANWNFSAKIILGDGVNAIVVHAVSPTGKESKLTKTVTYSTETF